MTEAPGTGPDDKLTTDPPLPPGTPDVDELVGDPVPDPGGADGGRDEPDHQDVAGGENPRDSVEPPD